MMTSGLMTPQGSDLSPSFRASGQTRRVNPRVARRRSLTATESHVRVAALLSSISRNNCYEGRDPAVIPDCFSSEFVADAMCWGNLWQGLLAHRRRAQLYFRTPN
jgi:hypothetical protein